MPANFCLLQVQTPAARSTAMDPHQGQVPCCLAGMCSPIALIAVAKPTKQPEYAQRNNCTLGSCRQNIRVAKRNSIFCQRELDSPKESSTKLHLPAICSWTIYRSNQKTYCGFNLKIKVSNDGKEMQITNSYFTILESHLLSEEHTCFSFKYFIQSCFITLASLRQFMVY